MPNTPGEFPVVKDDAFKLRPKSERDRIIEAARDMYATDEVEIDDDAAFSEADEHVWVSAWVYVPLPLEGHEAS